MVRRQAALDRLLVRLTKVAPDRWALKSGLALQTRLGARARVSIDVDADHLHGAEAARPDLQRAATRARDLVDLLLIRQHEHVHVGLLQEVVQRVFDRRATHAVPEHLPPPPAALAVAYRREARGVSIAAGLEEAHQLLALWLDPVLAGIRRTG
jgi:hypothetical protein